MDALVVAKLFRCGQITRRLVDATVADAAFALRRLKGENALALRRYVLGLALVAATEAPEGFLRQGCLLTLDPAAPGQWVSVGRDGQRTPLALTREVALDYATAAAAAFGVGPDRRDVKFKKELAQEDLKEIDKKKPGKKPKATAVNP